MTSQEVSAGQVWLWMGCEVRVVRVTKNGTWADVYVVPTKGVGWNKRQALPMMGTVLLKAGE